MRLRVKKQKMINFETNNPEMSSRYASLTTISGDNTDGVKVTRVSCQSGMTAWVLAMANHRSTSQFNKGLALSGDAIQCVVTGTEGPGRVMVACGSESGVEHPGHMR
jgi:hypothetical protein